MTPFTLEEFRDKILARYSETPRHVSEVELRRILEEGLFHQFQVMSEFLEQFRLIAAALVDRQDRDLAEQMKDMTHQAFRVFQDAALSMPSALVTPAKY